MPECHVDPRISSEAGHPRASPDRAEQEIEGERFLGAAAVTIRMRAHRMHARSRGNHEVLLPVHHLAAQGPGVGSAGTPQTARADTDHHQIAIETADSRPAGIDPSRLDPLDHVARSGKTPNSAKEPSRAGERIPDRLSRRASWVPAFT